MIERCRLPRNPARLAPLTGMSGATHPSSGKIATLLAAFWLLSLAAVAEPAARLPENVPVPETRAPAQRQRLPETSHDIPLPEAKPGADGAPEVSAPKETPPLEARPDGDGLPGRLPEPRTPPAPPPDPRSALRPDPSGKPPASELACRGRLTSLGVEFEEHVAEADPLGCAIPYPLVVKSMGKAIALEPAAEMNCAMAEASARFMQDVVSPSAKTELGKELKSISHASAYVCRPRNGTQKLSEHAFGNALDIASFAFADGAVVEVGPVPEEKAAKFLAAVRKAACGPFKTVLGPGSDPDHALHFHFDLAPRRYGGTFCQ